MLMISIADRAASSDEADDDDGIKVSEMIPKELTRFLPRTAINPPPPAVDDKEALTGKQISLIVGVSIGIFLLILVLIGLGSKSVVESNSTPKPLEDELDEKDILREEMERIVKLEEADENNTDIV